MTIFNFKYIYLYELVETVQLAQEYSSPDDDFDQEPHPSLAYCHSLFIYFFHRFFKCGDFGYNTVDVFLTMKPPLITYAAKKFMADY